ncbi:1178_t:CDS:1, partial [Dentiscutata heterogama]
EPFIRLVKSKLELAQIVENNIILYKDLGSCKLLEQEIVTKQLIALQNRLN